VENTPQKTMFNPTQKEEFIKYVMEKSNTKDRERGESNLINFFYRLSSIEEEFGKDFSMFNFDEIKIALSILCRRSVKYQITILSQLRQYLEWAIMTNNSLDTENRLIGFSTNDVDVSMSYGMSMVKNEEQLSEYLDITLRPMQDDTIDNMYRALFHMLFNGLDFQEAVDLKTNQIDLETKTIKLLDKNIDISEMCCKVINYLLQMDGYVVQLFRDGWRYVDKADTGHVLERTVDHRDNIEKAMEPAISNIFGRLKKELGYKISITRNDIYLSGVFYRTYIKELNEKKIDLSEYFLKYQHQVFSIKSPDAKINEGMEEYLSWKKAFGLTV